MLEQFVFTIDLLKFSTRITWQRSQIGLDKDVSQLPALVRKELDKEFSELMERFQRLWLENSRVGGLENSLEYFRAVLKELRA
jgi:hypothetical protein